MDSGASRAQWSISAVPIDRINRRTVNAQYSSDTECHINLIECIHDPAYLLLESGISGTTRKGWSGDPSRVQRLQPHSRFGTSVSENAAGFALLCVAPSQQSQHVWRINSWEQEQAAQAVHKDFHNRKTLVGKLVSSGTFGQVIGDWFNRVRMAWTQKSTAESQSYGMSFPSLPL